MVQPKKAHKETGHTLLQLQSLAEPEVISYIASLKKKFHRYAMPNEDARRIIDKAMGTKTLTELLHETRQQAG